MIDTDKYEGHTEGEWMLDNHDWNWAINIFGNDGETIEANAILIQDAPLLLAEVKKLRERTWGYQLQIKKLREENETLRKMDWEYECLWTWLAENTNLLNTIEPLMEEWKKEYDEE